MKRSGDIREENQYAVIFSTPLWNTTQVTDLLKRAVGHRQIAGKQLRMIN
jgi:hypothetical protein